MSDSTLASAPATRVQRVRHELKRRDLEVVRVAAISPHFKSITFGSESLADFVSGSFDDHVKFFFDAANGERIARDYTPRRYDDAARELTIEFALHGDGPAAHWAARAQPGDRATIGGPRGSFIIPTDFAWHLLAGDEAALPAIARRLEELPPSAHTIVICQTSDAADRRAFSGAQWVATPAELIAALRATTLPSGDGYVWCAGEAATTATLRRVLVDEKGHSRQAIRAAAYWKQGAVGHHQNLED